MIIKLDFRFKNDMIIKKTKKFNQNTRAMYSQRPNVKYVSDPRPRHDSRRTQTLDTTHDAGRGVSNESRRISESATTHDSRLATTC